jgi:glycosyltransferase involved in cell wall biosynthesis
MISVCIAMHNGGDYIIEELKSILPQLGVDDEVVISDDGSTDGCIQAVNDLHDDRIKVYPFTCDDSMHLTRHLVTLNFENALRQAKGDIIFMADQDDLWMPGKVKICVEQLKQFDLVISELSICDRNGKPTGEKWFNGRFRQNNPLKIWGLSYQGCAMAFNRKILEAVLPFPAKILSHDHWIGYIAEMISHVKFIDEPLMYYRIHDHNVSGDSASTNSFWFKVSYRFYMMKEFIKRKNKFIK